MVNDYRPSRDSVILDRVSGTYVPGFPVPPHSGAGVRALRQRALIRNLRQDTIGDVLLSLAAESRELVYDSRYPSIHSLRRRRRWSSTLKRTPK